MFKLNLEKAEEARDQIASICWIIEKAREFQKNIYFHFIDYAKAFDCVDHNKLWKILQETGIPDHPNCHLRSLYSSQGATVRTRHGTTLTLTLKPLSHVRLSAIPWAVAYQASPSKEFSRQEY